MNSTPGSRSSVVFGISDKAVGGSYGAREPVRTGILPIGENPVASGYAARSGYGGKSAPVNGSRTNPSAPVAGTGRVGKPSRRALLRS